MFLTCAECETQYRLDAALLGVGGRKVRCTVCNHIWFQPPEQAEDQPREEPPQEAPPEPQGDSVDRTFADILDRVNKPPSDAAVPEAVRMIERDFEIPVITARPMGMGPLQFGFFTFLLLSCLTLIPLFLGKDEVVRRFPVTAFVYKTMGFDVRAPGEGLRLQELQAESRSEGGKNMLSVKAALANISGNDQPWPAVEITLKSPYDAVMKTWRVPSGQGNILSGKSVPLEFETDDAPEGGVKIEMRVAGP